MALRNLLSMSGLVGMTVTAAVFSPRVRKALRQGAVYGMTAILDARDAVARAVTEPGPAAAGSGQEPAAARAGR